MTDDDTTIIYNKQPITADLIPKVDGTPDSISTTVRFSTHIYPEQFDSLNVTLDRQIEMAVEQGYKTLIETAKKEGYDALFSVNGDLTNQPTQVPNTQQKPNFYNKNTPWHYADRKIVVEVEGLAYHLKD